MPPEVMLKNALDVVANLEAWKPRQFPERPELLTYDDNQLVESYNRWQFAPQLGKGEREQLHYLATWTKAIYHVEGHNAGLLMSLAHALHQLELSGEHYSEAKGLRSFLREFHGVALPDPVPASRVWAERWASHSALNRRMFPMHLRRMTKPPVGQGGKRSGLVEPEDSPQRYIPFDEGDADEPHF